MKRLPELFGAFWTNFSYPFALAVFFYIFVPVYRPFEMVQILEMGRDMYIFNLTMMVCVILVVFAITRLAFYFLFKYLGSNWWVYSAFCLFEMVVCNYFLALYLYLMNDHAVPYFNYFAICLQYSILILIFPSELHLLITLAVSQDDKPEVQNPTIVRFSDYHKQVKFAISRDAILYIGAEENYIRIYYADDSGVKDYLLRSSMNAISSIASKYGLCRCHRSYYVNPEKIKALIKDKSGHISVELGKSGITIPVSRMYYPEISKRI